jgi:hypothetical protein
VLAELAKDVPAWKTVFEAAEALSELGSDDGSEEALSLFQRCIERGYRAQPGEIGCIND